MQMVSDVPIGAFLSGGVDSSAVVAFMSAASDRPVKTYAIGFGGGAAEDYYNELPYARKVAQRFGTDHHEIVVRPDVTALLPQLLWHMDEPIADTAFITTYLVSEFARRDVTVILSGVGGDELFGGYRRYLGQPLPGVLRPAAQGLRRAASALGEKLPERPPFSAAQRAAPGQGLSVDARACRSRSATGRTSRFSRRTPPRRCCAARETTSMTPSPTRSQRRPAATSLNQMLSVDAQTQLPDDLLLLTDKMSMAVSLECRVPLLDHELVELAARMPQEVKITRRPAQARAQGCAAGRPARRTFSSARNAASARRWEPG